MRLPAIAFLLVASLGTAARAEEVALSEGRGVSFLAPDLAPGRLADFAIPVFHAIPGVGAGESEVVRGSGVVGAVTGFARGVQYRLRWEPTPNRAYHRANVWAGAAGPELRLGFASDDEAEWEAVNVGAGGGFSYRIVRLGRFVAEFRGPRDEVGPLADRLREMVRVAGDSAPGLLIRPARGAYLAADPVPVSDRVRIWVHGRKPEEVRLTQVRLRLPRGVVTLSEGGFRTVILSDRIEIVLPESFGNDLSRARVWAEGRAEDGVLLRTLR